MRWSRTLSRWSWLLWRRISRRRVALARRMPLELRPSRRRFATFNVLRPSLIESCPSPEWLRGEPAVFPTLSGPSARSADIYVITATPPGRLLKPNLDPSLLRECGDDGRGMTEVGIEPGACWGWPRRWPPAPGRPLQVPHTGPLALGAEEDGPAVSDQDLGQPLAPRHKLGMRNRDPDAEEWPKGSPTVALLMVTGVSYPNGGPFYRAGNHAGDAGGPNANGQVLGRLWLQRRPPVRWSRRQRAPEQLSLGLPDLAQGWLSPWLRVERICAGRRLGGSVWCTQLDRSRKTIRR
jgi:hypothetical protein